MPTIVQHSQMASSLRRSNATWSTSKIKEQIRPPEVNKTVPKGEHKALVR